MGARLTRVTISFSELKYLFECPYSFKLRFLYGFNPPIHEALGYGKGPTTRSPRCTSGPSPATWSTPQQRGNRLLAEVRTRIAAAGDAVRANRLPRLDRWCASCDRCDLAGLCRDRECG